MIFKGKSGSIPLQKRESDSPFTADSINPTGSAESSFAKQTSFGTSNGKSNDFKEGLSVLYFPFRVVSLISALLAAGAYYQAI
jgi:hypothetical protein